MNTKLAYSVVSAIFVIQLTSVCVASPSGHKLKSLGMFGHKELCADPNDRQMFEKVLETVTCKLSGSFLESFVKDLCEGSSEVLSLWVSEIFDMDGNGQISAFEKAYFNYL